MNDDTYNNIVDAISYIATYDISEEWSSISIITMVRRLNINDVDDVDWFMVFYVMNVIKVVINNE